MTRLLQGPLGALLATLVVLATLWPLHRVQPLSTFDQPFYLGIAFDLRHHGRFTDGYMFAPPTPDGLRPPGMRFAPLYPALLAAVATIDPALRAGMDCQVRTRGLDPACPRAAPVMRWLQFAMLATTFVLTWTTALLATGRRRLAWTALLIALPTAGILLRSVDALMTETTALLLTTACLAAVLAAWRRHSLPWLSAAGSLLGLAILTRPAFLYLLYAAIPAGLALAAAAARGASAAGRRGPDPVPAAFLPTPRPLRPRDPAAPRPGRRALAALAAFALSAAVVVAPWTLRNAAVAGHPGLTRGYDSHTLVQRISFDSMTGREYGLSYLCWLPDGTGLGNALVGRGACDRFAWDERPDTFYSLGMGPLMRSTLAASGGWDRHLGYLLRHFILREPLWHAAVTIPLALRGLWIDHYWGLLLGPCCALLTLHALRGLRRRARPPAPRPRPARALRLPAAWPATAPPDPAARDPADGDATNLDAAHPHAPARDAPDPSAPAPPVAPPRPAPLRQPSAGPAPLRQPSPGPAPRPPDDADALWPADGAWQPCLLLVALPAWFMLAFNAAVAVNQVRYNLMLIPALSLSGALVLDPALRRALAAAPALARRLPAPPLAALLARARARLRPADLSSAASEAPPPPALPWRRPPLAARATGSARSSAAQRRRGPPSG